MEKGVPMNISFDYYKYFFYVCEFKSITKAADFLYISQPAISKQMRQLENKLGKKLFIKTNKGIDLTIDGKELYEDIKEAIERLNTIETKYNGKTVHYKTTIKILAGHLTTKNILLDTIAKINKKYPLIKFELATESYQKAVESLHQGKCDLIFFSLRESKELPPNICIKKLVDVEDIFIVGKELKKELPDYISINDLNQYPIICKEYVKDYYEELGIHLEIKYLLKNNWLVEEYAIRNLGIGVATKEYIKEELDSGLLTELKTDVPPPKWSLAYAYRENSLNYDIIKEITKQLSMDIEKGK